MKSAKKSANAKKAAGVSSTETVEEYLAALPEAIQSRLRAIHEIIRAACPKEATEVISYAMPAFAFGAKDAKAKAFFGYAAFKNHYSLFPFSGSFLNDFADDLKAYSRTTGSLHLPYDQPIPKALIRKLVKARVALMKASL